MKRHRREFAIVKDKTKIEGKVEVGKTVSVWADKDNPKQAAKIGVAGGARPGR
ncbi:MAG: hypothetical protein L0Z53_12830 [Acidobacteriales bacterium]|nr:hypothetical protein [Terriglobales bacterium]